MRIYLIRKRNAKELEKHPFDLRDSPATLRELLTTFTLEGLREAKKVLGDLPLSQEEISEQTQEGRVRFNERYGENHDTPARALQTLLGAFEGGLIRVFIDGEEAVALDSPLHLHEESELVFPRFTFLEGRMWSY